MSTEQRDLCGLVEKLRQEQEFVQFYKAQIRQGVQELNKSCDDVFHSFWVCHRLSLGLSRVLTHHVASYEWSLALDQGVEFTNAAISLPSHSHVDQYSKFLSALLTETKLLSEILQLAESEALDCHWLINDLMSVLFAHCLFQRDHAHFLRLLQELLRQHVKFCSSSKDLFGGVDSMFNKVLLEYCSQLFDLKSFLGELLEDIVMEIISIDDYLEFDVSKAGSRFHAHSERNGGLVESDTFLFGEDLESSCDVLASLAMKVVDKLAKMSTHLPPSIKWLLGLVKRVAKRKWPLSLEEERRLVSDALFGSILSSAIVNPDTHAVVDRDVVIGPVARYNLTQVIAVLQRSSWNIEKQPIHKVVKRMDMELYNSVLDALDMGGGEDEPVLPAYLPGLKRSSFLASQDQLNNLVGLAASLLTNREGRGAFHSQLSELLSTLSHTLIDMASTHPYTVSPVTASLPSSAKKARGDKRVKKRGSMGGVAHMSTQPPLVPRSRSVGTIATLAVSGGPERDVSPPAESASGCGFILPTKVLILPFIDDPPSPSKGQWDFHLLTEEEFMAPVTPTLLTIDEESKHSSPDDTTGSEPITTATTPDDSPIKLSPAPVKYQTAGSRSGRALGDNGGGRLRSNTMPPPINPATVELSQELVSEGGTPLSSWSPGKGSWLHGGLDLVEEVKSVNPYDRLEAKDVYIPSSSSSITTSPLSPLSPSFHGVDTPTTVTSPVEATGEVSRNNEVGVVSDDLSGGMGELPEPGSEDDDLLLSKEMNAESAKKSKKRRKFWPFRKHKSVESERKSRSKSEASSKVKLEASLTKARSRSEHGVLDEPDSGSLFKKRRSYTLLTGHITAKYAALNARKRIAQTTPSSLPPLPAVRAKRVERFDSLPPAEMSSEMFGKSLYCDQLKYKLRAALQSIHSSLVLSKETDTRYQLVLLIQHSLQQARWRHARLDVSLLSELLRMVEPLSTELVEAAIEGLYSDYNKRSAYIGYLVKSHQRFQDVKLQVASLQDSVDRLRAVSREVFVGFAVEQFLELRETELKEFSQEMSSLLPADDKCLLVSTKQRTLEEAINNNSTWLCWSDMEEVLCCLDNHLFAYVYEHVFHPNGDSDTMRDQIYSQHLTRLADTITVSHKSLQIPSVYHSSCPWSSAQTHLKVMSVYKSPRGKVRCVVHCCKILISLLQLAKCGDPPGADDMFPVIVYVLIKTNPPGLLSTVQYIKHFIESELSGEDAYWWTQFSTAVEFTKTLE